MSATEQPREGALAPSPLAAVQSARERIARALRVGHLVDDPLAPVLEAQDAALEAQGALYAANVELAKLRAEIPTTVLERLEKAAVTGASRYAAQLATTHAWRTALIAGGIYLASLVTVAIIADQWGHAAERAEVEETEQQVRDAFTAGPVSASAWALLMQNNNAAAALAQCKGSRVYTDDAGRRACMVALYIEPPRQTAPDGAR